MTNNEANNGYTIIGNNHKRALITFNDLTAKEQKDFDYIKVTDDNEDGLCDSEYRFFRYKGNVYDVYEYTDVNALQDASPFKGWTGYAGDTYFSGTLIKLCMDTDEVIVGRYYC